MFSVLVSSMRIFGSKKYRQPKGLVILFMRWKSGQERAKNQITRKLQPIADNWVQKLKRENVPEAELSVKYIVAKALAGPNDGIKARLPLTTINVLPSQEDQINFMCQQRLERQPIQYILGDWEFRYLSLAMKPPIFIPRPETEELVDIIASYHQLSRSSEDFTFLEVGCGSGAICLSILKEYKQTNCVAIDINPDAASLTKRNGTRYNLEGQLKVLHANIENFEWNHKFDAIISNPPYIPRKGMDNLESEVKSYEDMTALCGGKDGMDVIRLIFSAAPHLLKPSGSIWLEIDLSHPPFITKLLQDSPLKGLKLNRFYNDFTKRTRFCHVIS